jgi:hypothetical protein
MIDAGIGANSASGGYDITNSLKFESDNAEYLMAEGRGQGNQQTWTYSVWLKRSEVDNGHVAQYIFSAGSDGKLGIYFRDDASYPDDRIFIYLDEGNSQKWSGQVNQSFRDTAAWYHFVFACDTTDSTPADRTKLYINGVQQTITYNDTMNVNTSTRIGDSGGKFALGAAIANPGYNFNGYMAEAVLVDGSALPPTSFGEYDEDSGIWKPKDVSSLSLGTTGFHMNFDDSSNVGKVQRGNNGGNFDKYNLTSADQATDTPTNNFATLNPLIIHGANDYFVITEGGTNIIQSAQVGWGTMTANIAVNSGKWYAEIKSASSLVMIGNSQVDDPVTYSSTHLGQLANTTSLGMGYYNYSGNIYRNAGDVGYGVAWDSGDIMGIALEFKSDGTANMYVAENNVWINSADPAAGTGGAALNYGGALPTGLHFTFAVALYNNTGETEVNFGGFTTISISSAATDANGYGTFEYAPPTGYYALCTKNLAEFG